mgnify:CR=1 FL=1
MTDQELLQAIGQVVEAKLEPIRQDVCELKDSVRRLEGRLDRLEARVDSIDARMDILESRTDKLDEQVRGIRIYMETDQRRTLNLLLEGQQALWDRFVPHEEFNPLKDRTEVLEATVRLHSQEIRELQPA